MNRTGRIASQANKCEIMSDQLNTFKNSKF